MLYFFITLMFAISVMTFVVWLEHKRSTDEIVNMQKDIDRLTKINESIRIDNEFYRNAYHKLARENEDRDIAMYKSVNGIPETV